MSRCRGSIVAFGVLLTVLGCTGQPEPIRQLSLTSRGVSYTVAFNGTRSDLLSTESLIGSSSSGPLNLLDVKTQSGTNTVEVTIVAVDPEKEPLLHIDLQEMAPGEVVDTTQSTAATVLFTDDQTAEGLIPGLVLKYSFRLP